MCVDISQESLQEGMGIRLGPPEAAGSHEMGDLDKRESIEKPGLLCLFVLFLTIRLWDRISEDHPDHTVLIMLIILCKSS